MKIKLNNTISRTEIKELFDYSSKTGVFINKINRSPTARKGCIAGSITDQGYIVINIKGNRHKAHRLAWLIMIGEWPEKQIDHKNGIRDDNRWNNLRLATNSQNHANGKLYKNNTSGYKGVIWSKEKKKWRADVRFYGETKFLGYYDNIKSAAEAYKKAAQKYFGNFMRIN